VAEVLPDIAKEIPLGRFAFWLMVLCENRISDVLKILALVASIVLMGRPLGNDVGSWRVMQR